MADCTSSSSMTQANLRRTPFEVWKWSVLRRPRAFFIGPCRYSPLVLFPRTKPSDESIFAKNSRQSRKSCWTILQHNFSNVANRSQNCLMRTSNDTRSSFRHEANVRIGHNRRGAWPCRHMLNCCRNCSGTRVRWHCHRDEPKITKAQNFGFNPRALPVVFFTSGFRSRDFDLQRSNSSRFAQFYPHSDFGSPSDLCCLRIGPLAKSANELEARQYFGARVLNYSSIFRCARDSNLRNSSIVAPRRHPVAAKCEMRGPLRVRESPGR
jgi:hypothetical protein